MIKLLCRGAVGSVLIYVITLLAGMAGVVLPVGVNLLSFLSCAILGAPGLMLVYGLGFILFYV